MKLRLSFLYEMSPEETIAKTQALEKIALSAVTVLGDIAKKEFNENIERMRYSNMESERRDKRWHQDNTDGSGGYADATKPWESSINTPTDPNEQ